MGPNESRKKGRGWEGMILAVKGYFSMRRLIVLVNQPALMPLSFRALSADSLLVPSSKVVSNCHSTRRPVEMWWHTVTHGKGSEGETGEWSGWPVLFTLSRNMVYTALLPLLLLMLTPRLPVVDWTDVPVDLNGLVHFAERRNLVSARVPSHFNWPLQLQKSADLIYTAVEAWRHA